MVLVPLSEARAELVRNRALEGAAEVLSRGEALTFAAAAAAAGIPERTFYRYFPTREALLGALFAWANQRIGFSGELPTSEAAVVSLVRQVFPGFDGIAAVVRELLIAPEGRTARLAEKSARQKASLAVVHQAAEGLDRASSRRLAAVVQLLTVAGTWQTLSDYWDMDGAEAAEASVLAIELLLDGARARARRSARNAHSDSPSKATAKSAVKPTARKVKA